MNYQNKLNLIETKQRLRHWADWCHDIITMGHSFPSKTIIAQLIDAKGELIRSTNATLAPDNDEAEEVDELINLYAKDYPERARVLVLHYLNPEKTKDKIDLSKVSRPTYFRYLDDSEEWISKHLQ
ncbi:MAG: hypothetical protein COV52_01820 [Gammaproteobacteria bacterium CG11_big_fil_rev_8_21_14_0_20_46_22]|nr:MAG: hypothetical protein COW05_05715 [Gammaproteobacteria bacterium CG12_big_fil_rev_8_21_14_0_65_46_12]PIR11852.1 MAG: hypothetical protein COV52_01820 [Gammaproteobacteria bacterium CG11_big_fil_rev_8_21_14_0_20_46_22]